MKKNTPLVLIVLSFILILANLFTTDYNKLGFWLRISSSVLIIVAMFATIKERKNKNMD